MKATIDEAGRVVLPNEIREAAGLRPGVEVEVRLSDGRIEIEPETLPVELVWRGRLLVAVPKIPVEPLTNEMVNETRESIERERFPYW
jgi:AbrB family looped-hinge helix DNA binding protein